MSETTSREARIDQLEQFANAAPEATYQLPAVTAAAPPPFLIHGAQKIEGNRRDLRKVDDMIDRAAAILGEDAFYSIPFKDKKKGTTTFVEGLSIDGAMEVHKAYGNAACHAWVQSEGHDHWMIVGWWIDKETGTEVSRVFRQNKGASRIGGDSAARNLDAALQIGQSKAERNVIIKALGIECKRAFEVAKGDLTRKIGKDIDGWRDRVVRRLADTNIPLDRVEAVIGRPAAEWLVLDIVKVVQRAKAITDGEAPLDDTFPKLKPEPDERDVLNAELDKIANPTPPAASPPDQPESVTTAAEPVTPSKDSAAVRNTYEEMVRKLIQLATDTQVDEQFKLEQLDQAQLWWEDQLPKDWHGKVKTAIQTAAKVAKTEMVPDRALKYLNAL